MMNDWSRPEPFFRHFAWFLLAFVILSFLGKAILDTEDLPPITPLHHCHAVTMGAWFVLFALQPTLLHLGRAKLHQILGRSSPILVVTFFGFAIPISLLNWARVGEPLIVTANGMNFTLFLGFYLAAIAWRRSEATHKRLMLYATLSIMGPAAGRIPELFDASPFVAAPIIFVLNLTPVVHDFVVHRRVHPASWIGFGLMILTIPIVVTLSGSEASAALLSSVLGPPGTPGP